MIKIMIVDDQAILVEGLKMILSAEEDIEVVATASDGLEAISLAEKYTPDLILMDISMKNLNGIDASEKIKESNPLIKIILLTTFSDDAYIKRGFKIGVDGYALKATDPKEIYNGIHLVMNDGVYIDQDIAKKVISNMNISNASESENDTKIDSLTPREIDIIKYIAKGQNTLEISQSLHLSEGTIKNHLTKIMDKLELRDRTQVAIWALKHKINE